MNLSRRSMFAGLAAALCAPAIVRPGLLMPVKRIRSWGSYAAGDPQAVIWLSGQASPSFYVGGTIFINGEPHTITAFSAFETQPEWSGGVITEVRSTTVRTNP